MRLLIMGAPGAGKGTQAFAIAERYAIPAISTGNIFRLAVARRTPLGKKIDELLQSGDFVPDRLTEQVVAERLREDDARDGWLLDGYPRTMHQVKALDKYLAEENHTIDAVIYLNVSKEKLVQRLLRRGQLEGRHDDTEATIAHRMEVFESETAPILSYYDKQGQLLTIDGDGRIEEVSDRIALALKEKLGH